MNRFQYRHCDLLEFVFPVVAGPHGPDRLSGKRSENQRGSIKRVVAAMSDPFPKVAGEGFEHLRRAGIEVTVGVLEEDARQLNAPYIHRMTTWAV